MAKHEMFLRAFDKIDCDLRASIDALLAEADANLERLAVNTFGPPNPSENTLFAPPEKPVRVHCWHCDGKYKSDKMRLEYRPRMQAAVVSMLGHEESRLAPLWWCKNDYCDGAGFGHDLHEIASRKSKPGRAALAEER